MPNNENNKDKISSYIFWAVFILYALTFLPFALHIIIHGCMFSDSDHYISKICLGICAMVCTTVAYIATILTLKAFILAKKKQSETAIDDKFIEKILENKIETQQQRINIRSIKKQDTKRNGIEPR